MEREGRIKRSGVPTQGGPEGMASDALSEGHNLGQDVRGISTERRNGLLVSFIKFLGGLILRAEQDSDDVRSETVSEADVVDKSKSE